MSNRLVYIYALTADDGRVRYIGKTINPPTRLEAHRSGIKTRSHVAIWIRSHLARGEQICMSILETCSEANWEERERRWIAHGRALGWKLTNTHPGGIAREIDTTMLEPGTAAYDAHLRGEARRKRLAERAARAAAEEERRRLWQIRRARREAARYMRSLIDPSNTARLARTQAYIDRKDKELQERFLEALFGKSQTLVTV